VGLGTGVLATYGEPGDTMRFWEIDPQIIELAQGSNAKFTFLKDTKANVEVIEEDGRLGIEEDKQPGYDILIVDAFSGDAIPIQLVTREAFRLYLSKLNGPDAVLVFHITNRVVDLTAVMLGFSRTEHVPLRFFMSSNAEWTMFSRNPAMLDLVGPDEKLYSWDQVESVLWTDGYSSLVPVLRR
jgi:spermidine synthase